MGLEIGPFPCTRDCLLHACQGDWVRFPDTRSRIQRSRERGITMRSLRRQSAVIFVLVFAVVCLASNARAQLTDLYIALGAGGGHPSGGVDIFKTDGTHVSTLVADGSGGIFDPIQPLFGPDGNLYVS